MMTREMMVEVLEGLGADVSYDVIDEGFDVMIEDFGGFDEEWSEIIRDYDNPKAVKQFEDMLQSECVSIEGDYNIVYHFEGFDVEFHYASEEI